RLEEFRRSHSAHRNNKSYAALRCWNHRLSLQIFSSGKLRGGSYACDFDSSALGRRRCHSAPRTSRHAEARRKTFRKKPKNARGVWPRSTQKSSGCFVCALV